MICQTRDGNDKPTNYYYGEGSFRQTGTSATAGEKRYYAKDHLGSVRDVLTQTGTQIASYDYDPYGSLINTPTSAPEFGYAGMQYHAPSGLYLTKYRAYDPRTGRWLSRDPIGEAGGLNLYGYVGGNPVSQVDPFGLRPCNQSWWDNVKENYHNTIDHDELALPFSLGLGGVVAANMRGYTIFQGLLKWHSDTKTVHSLWGGYFERIRTPGLLRLTAATAAIQYVGVQLAWHGGVLVGSGIRASLIDTPDDSCECAQ